MGRSVCSQGFGPSLLANEILRLRKARRNHTVVNAKKEPRSLENVTHKRGVETPGSGPTTLRVASPPSCSPPLLRLNAMTFAGRSVFMVQSTRFEGQGVNFNFPGFLFLLSYERNP